MCGKILLGDIAIQEKVRAKIYRKGDARLCQENDPDPWLDSFQVFAKDNGSFWIGIEVNQGEIEMVEARKLFCRLDRHHPA
jgi:hypothetical protein